MEGIRIWCENTGAYVEVPMRMTLKELSDNLALNMGSSLTFPVLAALVDNKLKSLDY